MFDFYSYILYRFKIETFKNKNLECQKDSIELLRARQRYLLIVKANLLIAFKLFEVTGFVILDYIYTARKIEAIVFILRLFFVFCFYIINYNI